ncbi:Uncharacterised protein [Yersinia frederiksenii]|uniref:Uncharacterized protein n=2 Tax=Yersinia frederiksenii TaxID=29484 RepID=A0A380PVI2_YERFR|nr:hypothetical protein CRN75_03340 [Yersinia frederiksenii]KGA48840.1 hypothetical protein DJ58_4158 [Yersinia frederiksenii ATCC 33641]CND16584.1 Uncharacterised protein [Yersinia frederiksenii]CNG29809.1 Uncharacterised protein [Yersinia frederiksenii]SUP76977.1 Uncharacterised protein [Yersinia frederiksenii]
MKDITKKYIINDLCIRKLIVTKNNKLVEPVLLVLKTTITMFDSIKDRDIKALYYRISLSVKVRLTLFNFFNFVYITFNITSMLSKTRNSNRKKYRNSSL